MGSRVSWYGNSYMNQLQAQVRGRAEAVGSMLALEAAARAPKDTGGAAATITHQVENTADGIRIRVGPSAEGFYLTFHETGTSRMAATPWARPTLVGNLTRLVPMLRS